MTKREIAVLACRVLSIVAIFSVLQTGSYWLASVSQIMSASSASFGSALDQIRVIIWLQASPIVLQGVIAFLLWTQAPYISAKMVGEDDENLVPVEFDERFQRLAFSVVGAYSLTYSLPQFVLSLIAIYRTANLSPMMQRDWSQITLNCAGAALTVALGLWLLCGSSALIGWLKNIRHIGRDSQLRQESSDAEIPFRPEK